MKDEAGLGHKRSVYVCGNLLCVSQVVCACMCDSLYVHLFVAGCLCKYCFVLM